MRHKGGRCSGRQKPPRGRPTAGPRRSGALAWRGRPKPSTARRRATRSGNDAAQAPRAERRGIRGPGGHRAAPTRATGDAATGGGAPREQGSEHAAQRPQRPTRRPKPGKGAERSEARPRRTRATAAGAQRSSPRASRRAPRSDGATARGAGPPAERNARPPQRPKHHRGPRPRRSAAQRAGARGGPPEGGNEHDPAGTHRRPAPHYGTPHQRRRARARQRPAPAQRGRRRRRRRRAGWGLVAAGPPLLDIGTLFRHYGEDSPGDSA